MSHKAQGPNGRAEGSAGDDHSIRPVTSAPDDEVIADLVIAYGEALRTGKAFPDRAAEFQKLDPNLREQLKSAKDCLNLIERVRQYRQLASEGLPITSGAPLSAGCVYATCGDVHRIGRFEIIRELGRGSHGIVFLARDPGLNREIALKVPRPEAILTPQLRSRFLREGKAAGRLNHPSILAAHEAGEAGPVCYLVQTYCAGPSLSAWLAKQTNPVPCELAAEIVAQLANGVDYAHKQGVLHRDIKPANVMLDPLPLGTEEVVTDVWSGPNKDDRRFAFTPKLTDFGLAKSLNDDPNATATSGTLGTAVYMPPEQAAGQFSLVGPRSDVYSLGALLYELLTRRPPIVGVNQLDTMRLIATEDPQPIGGLRPGVPSELEAICLKCLEKTPDQRYATAADLAADLRRFLDGESVLASPVGKIGRAVRRLRRLPLSVLLGLAAIGLLTGGLVWSVLVNWSNRHEAIVGGVDPRVINPEVDYLGGMDRVSQGYSDSVANRGDVKTAVRELDAFLERHGPRRGEADYRGFEWHYLWRLCHPDLVAQPFPKLFDLVGHQGEVYCVTFSPDGKRLATAGQDHTARIWDAGTGRLIATLTGHTNDVNWISFYPVAGDPHVLTASDDKTVRIWDCESGKLEGVLSGDGAKVVAVEVARSQHHHGDETSFKYEIISGDEVGHLRIWDWQTRRELKVIPAHAGRIECIARIRGADQWVTASADGTAKEWNSSSWTSTRSHLIDSTAEAGNPAIHSASSNTGSTVVAFGGGRDGRFTNHLRKDGTGTAVAGSIPVDDLLTGARWLTLVGPQAAKEGVQFYPGQLLLASTARGDSAEDRAHHVVFWDIPTQSYWTPCGMAVPQCWCAAFSADGTRYATATVDGIVRVWDSSNLPNGRRLEGTNHVVERAPTSISYSPNGKRLLVTQGGWGYRVPGHRFAIWDVAGERPKVVSAESTENNPIDSYAGCFSADGKFIAVDSSELEFDPPRALSSSIRILEVASLRESRHLDGYYGVANKILMSPDGENVVASTGNRFRKRTQLNFWLGTHGGRADQIWESKHVGDFVASALSPDGKLLATNRDQVEIYEFPALRLVKTLPFDLRGGAICFSPDGQMLAAAGEDGIIHLCHPRLGDCAQTLVADGHMVLSLAFSPDGTRLAVGVDGGTRVDLWHVASGKRLAPLAMPNDLVSVTDLSFSPDCRTLAAAGSIQREAGSVFLFPLDSVDKLAKKGQP
jgi:serine/threonine protein kinase/WD40 repeat protein